MLCFERYKSCNLSIIHIISLSESKSCSIFREETVKMRSAIECNSVVFYATINIQHLPWTIFTKMSIAFCSDNGMIWAKMHLKAKKILFQWREFKDDTICTFIIGEGEVLLSTSSASIWNGLNSGFRHKNVSCLLLELHNWVLGSVLWLINLSSPITLYTIIDQQTRRLYFFSQIWLVFIIILSF